MKKGIIIFFALALVVLLIWFVVSKGNNFFVDTDNKGNLIDCSVDADCVPADCCHSSSCVNNVDAPDNCENLFCTTECAPETMDCNQGYCSCVDNKCTVSNSDK